MKHNNQHLIDVAKKLFQHNKGQQQTQLMNPKRDWLIGVLIGLCIMISMVGWSAYTYLEKRDAIGLDDSSVQAEVPVYRAEVVEDALELFAERQERFAQLNQSGAPVIETPVVVPEDSTVTASTTTNETNEEEVVIETPTVTEVEGDDDENSDQQTATPEVPPESEEVTATPVLSN